MDNGLLRYAIFSKCGVYNTKTFEGVFNFINEKEMLDFIGRTNWCHGSCYDECECEDEFSCDCECSCSATYYLIPTGKLFNIRSKEVETVEFFEREHYELQNEQVNNFNRIIEMNRKQVLELEQRIKQLENDRKLVISNFKEFNLEDMTNLV